MTTHALARLLLDGPDLPVVFHEFSEVEEVKAVEPVLACYWNEQWEWIEDRQVVMLA